jgi:hypothetical protein
LIYDDPSPHFGPIRQGEILADLWEFRPLVAPVATSQGTSPEVIPVYHPFVIVMSADCDLEQDFKVRFGGHQAQEVYAEGIPQEGQPAILPHVLLCAAYKSEEMTRPRIPGSDVLRRIRQNQDERYHYFHATGIGNSSSNSVPELYLDFKKMLALPTQSLYNGICNGGLKRIAMVPNIYVHDLMHRFYGFLSRVALPE